jgi:menaquinone-dependent protoporphyrinogen IX oxidase
VSLSTQIRKILTGQLRRQFVRCDPQRFQLGGNLKLSPEKFEFFKRKVKFVGLIVSEEGIEIDPSKTDKVTNWPKPQTPEA